MTTHTDAVGRNAAPPAGPDADRPGRATGELALAALAVVAATFLAYSNALHGAFQFDDRESIVANQGLRDLHGYWPPVASRALGYLTFALNYRWGGLDPFGYHLVNVAIHAINALLVLALVRLVLRTPALQNAGSPLLRRFLPPTAALLFAVHPLATQAVTYVVQRLTSLATLFFLLAVALHLAARLARTGPGSRARYVGLHVLSFLAAAAAMKTKEIAFTLPVVAAACEILLFRESSRLASVLPLACAALLVPLDRALGGASAADGRSALAQATSETFDVGRWEYLLTQLRVVVAYLRLLVLPVGQSIDHDVRISTSLADPAVLGASAVLVAIGAGARRLLANARRAGRAEGVLVAFGVAWFFVTCTVESSVIPIRDLMNEHRAYLPGVGAFVALATALLWGIERVRAGIPSVPLVLTVIAAATGVLGAATYARNRVWQDEVSLWSDAISKSPRKARPHLGVGVALLRAGRVEEAVPHVRTALALAPRYADAHANLGVALLALGRIGEAEAELRTALALDPGSAEVRINLADILLRRSETEEGIALLAEALDRDPRNPDGHNVLGNAYAANGRLEDAEREYREAIRLDPAYAEAHANLGRALARRGLHAEALAAVRTAAGLSARPEIVFVLATVLDGAGRRTEAIAEYERFAALAAPEQVERRERARTRARHLRAERTATEEPPR